MGGSGSKKTFDDVNLVDLCFSHQIGSENCVRERLKRKVEKSLFQKKGLSPFENLPDELFKKITFLLAPSQVILLASCSSWFCGRLLLNRLENKFRPSSWSFLSHEYYLTKLQAQQKSVDSSSSPSTSLCWCQLPNCEEIKDPKYTLYLIGGASCQNSYFVPSKDFYEFDVRRDKWNQLPDCPIAAPGLQLRDERGRLVVGNGSMSATKGDFRTGSSRESVIDFFPSPFYCFDPITNQWAEWKIPNAPWEEWYSLKTERVGFSHSWNQARPYKSCGSLLFSWNPLITSRYSSADNHQETPESFRVNRFFVLDLTQTPLKWRECAPFPKGDEYLFSVDVLPDEAHGKLFVSGVYGVGKYHCPSKYSGYNFKETIRVSYIYDINGDFWRKLVYKQPQHSFFSGRYLQAIQEKTNKKEKGNWTRITFCSLWNTQQEECTTIDAPCSFYPHQPELYSPRAVALYNNKVYIYSGGVYCYDLKVQEGERKWKKIVGCPAHEPSPGSLTLSTAVSKSYLKQFKIEEKERENEGEKD